MLCTLQELKDSLAITGTDNDTLLNSSLFQANGLIAGYIGVDLSDTTTDRVFTTVVDNSFGFVKLPLYPVLEVVSLTANGEAIPSTNDSRWLEPRLGFINDLNGYGRNDYNGGPFSRHGARVTVVYRTGYTIVPPDLKAVCLNIAGAIYNNGGSIPNGSSVGGTGELKSLTMFDAMSMSFDTGNSSGTTVSGAEALLEPWLFMLKGHRVNVPGMA